MANPENPRYQEILRVAAQSFHRKGFHATSIQDIADAVRMLKGSLYYYISSKDELLQQIINNVHQDAFAFMQDVFESDAPPVERVRMFVTRHIVYCIGRIEWMGVYLHEYKAMQPATREHVREMRDRYERELSRIIDEGKADGLFHTPVETRLAARAILGMCNSVYHWYSPDRQLTAQDIGQAFGELAVGTLVVREPASDPPHAGDGPFENALPPS